MIACGGLPNNFDSFGTSNQMSDAPAAEFLDQPFFPEGMSEPDPEDPISRGFWAAAAEGRLVVQECAACGQVQYPPELNCRACYGFDLGWREVRGTGRIWSWVGVAHPAHPALREFGPYVAALVELDDLPEIKLVGAVVDAEAETVQIGDRVRVVFERTAADLAQPRWRLV